MADGMELVVSFTVRAQLPASSISVRALWGSARRDSAASPPEVGHDGDTEPLPHQPGLRRRARRRTFGEQIVADDAGLLAESTTEEEAVT